MWHLKTTQSKNSSTVLLLTSWYILTGMNECCSPSSVFNGVFIFIYCVCLRSFRLWFSFEICLAFDTKCVDTCVHTALAVQFSHRHFATTRNALAFHCRRRVSFYFYAYGVKRVVYVLTCWTCATCYRSVLPGH